LNAAYIFRLPVMLTVTFCCNIWGQDDVWKEIWKGEEKTVFVEVNSVKRSRRGVTAWMKHVLAKPLEVTQFNVTASMMMEKVEYSKDQKWSLRVLMYDKDARQLVAHTNPANMEGLELLPGRSEAHIATEV